MNTRRGSILIEPYKQLRFGITFLVTNLVFSTIVLAVFSFYLWDIYGALSIYFRLDEKQSLITFSKMSEPAIASFGVVVLFILTTLFLSARYTHQFFGPMVSIRRFLDDLLAGRQPTPIQVRTSDQLQELVERLNRVAKKFESGHDGQALELVTKFVDQLAAGTKPKPLNLPDSEPLYELSKKLNQLAQSKRS